MQLSLVAAFIPIVNILWCGGVSANNCSLASVLLNCGYEQACTYSTLKACAINGFPTPNECSLTEDLVLEVKNNTNTLTVVPTLLQEAKSERENVTSILTEVKTLLQVVKSKQEIELKNSDALHEKFVSVTSAQLEIKSELEKVKKEQEFEKQRSEALTDTLENATISLTKKLGIVVDKAEQNSDTLAAIMASLSKINPRKNCADLRVLLGDEFSGGVQTVYPYLPNPKPVVVFCHQVTDGGGWTVIQSRSPLPIRENFTRSWIEYVKGFGDLKGEFWLGLDNIHALTNSAKMELRIDLEDAEGKKAWALYSSFHVGDAASEYVLRIGGYSGDAGDGMTDPGDEDYNLNAMKFSTQDNDNDLWTSRNCAKDFKGGWWFNSCSLAQLNGLPIVGEAPFQEGIIWQPFRGWYHSMKKATMKLRPVSLGF